MASGLTKTDSMMYVGAVPWHGFGKPAEQNLPYKEAIKVAGIDWKVVQVAAGFFQHEGEGSVWKHVPDEQYRANIRQDTGEFLAFVKKRYSVIQNEQAFQFMESLVGDEITFNTAGSLQGGRIVWMLAAMKEEMWVGPDKVKPYLLLMNTHDGSRLVTVCPTPIRVVCANTLQMALTTAEKRTLSGKLSIWTSMHTKNWQSDEKIEEAAKVLGVMRKAFEITASRYNWARETPMTLDQFSQFLDVYMPPVKAERVNTARETLTSLFTNGIGIQGQPAIQNTRWAAINAITEYTTYRYASGRDAEGVNKTWEDAAYYNWIGGGFQNVSRAIGLLYEDCPDMEQNKDLLATSIS